MNFSQVFGTGTGEFFQDDGKVYEIRIEPGPIREGRPTFQLWLHHAGEYRRGPILATAALAMEEARILGEQWRYRNDCGGAYPIGWGRCEPVESGEPEPGCCRVSLEAGLSVPAWSP